MLTRRRLLSLAPAALLMPLTATCARKARADGYDATTEAAWLSATGYSGQGWIDYLEDLQNAYPNGYPKLGGVDAMSKMPPEPPAGVVPPADAVTYQEFWDGVYAYISGFRIFINPIPIWGGGL